MSIASSFNEEIYKLRHPVYASYADAGKKLLSDYNITGEWLNYFDSVAKLFGVTGAELAGYVSSEFVLGDIKKVDHNFVVEPKVDYLCDFIKGISFLADKIRNLPPSSVDNPRFKLLLEDMPGQPKFDDLKKAVKNSAYSMVFTRSDSTKGAERDFENIQITMYGEAFNLNHHVSAVVIPFLDNLIDVNDVSQTANRLLGVYHDDDFEVSADPDSLLNRLNKIYNPAVISKRISDCINNLASWADVKSLITADYARDVIIEKLKGIRAYRRNELDVGKGADDLIKSVNSIVDWNGFLALNEGSRSIVINVIKSVTSSRKYACTVEQSINGSLEQLLSYVDFSRYVASGELVRAKFVAYMHSSAMPCLGFYNCEFNHIALAGLLSYDVNGSVFMSNPFAVSIGPGSIGKTQNKSVNDYLLNGNRWLDSGKMSTDVSFLDLPLFKEMFYSKWNGLSSVKDFKAVTGSFNNVELQFLSTDDELLNLELISRLRAFVIPGSIGLTDVLERSYHPSPDSLVSKMKSWIEYAAVRINDCNSLDDFKKFFGIDKSFMSDYYAKVANWDEGVKSLNKRLSDLESTKAGDELRLARENLKLAFRVKFGDHAPEPLAKFLADRLKLSPESISDFLVRAKNDFM